MYGGLLLLMRVWLRLAEVMKLHPGASIKSLWWMLLLWATPMIVAPPLFSRDVFSYAAQGEMTFAHISPYLFGPFTLGSSPYVTPVDPLWGNAPAPYGPFFLFMDGTIDRVTRPHELWTVLGLRLLETLAVAMIGYGVVMLARGLNRDPGEAFVLSAMNPLVLLTLIGGAHNDAHHGRLPGRGHRARGATTSGLGAVFFVRAPRPSRPRPPSVWPSWPGRGSDRRARHSRTGCDRSRIAVVIAAATLGVWTLARRLRIRLGRQPALQRHGAIVGRAGDRRRSGAHQHPARPRARTASRRARCCR